MVDKHIAWMRAALAPLRILRQLLLNDSGTVIMEYSLSMCFLTLPAIATLELYLQGLPVLLSLLTKALHTANTTGMPLVSLPAAPV